LSGSDQVPRISADEPFFTVALVKSRESIDAVVARAVAATDAEGERLKEATSTAIAAAAANDVRVHAGGLTFDGNKVTVTPMQN